MDNEALDRDTTEDEGSILISKAKARGLQAFVAEFDVVDQSRRPLCLYRYYETNHEWMDSLIDGVVPILNTYFVGPGEETIFGKTPYARVLFGLVAVPDVLERWFKYQSGRWHPSFLDRLRGLDEGMSLRSSHSRMVPIETLIRTEYRSPFGDHYDYIRPAINAPATDAKLEELKELFETCAFDIGTIGMARCRSRPPVPSEATSFLVGGVIPRGTVTLLLGNRKVGKSALALELAVAVARRESEWAGFATKANKGFVVYLAGEAASPGAPRRSDSS
jgi:hypothetical protein